MVIYCVVIAAVWQSTGFVMALFLAGLRGVDGEIFKAAQVDGATTHHLPPDHDSEHAAGVLLVLLIVCHMTIKTFDLVVALTAGGPAPRPRCRRSSCTRLPSPRANGRRRGQSS